jgi:signal transduction histidine kinase
METRDSYAALALSIERTVRAELAPEGEPPELAPSIDRLLLDESRSRELQLGWLRAGVVGSYFLIALGRFLFDTAGVREARVGAVVLGGVSLAISAVLVAALRRGWCPRWLQYAGPAFDGSMIWVGYIVASLAAGGITAAPPPGVLVCVAILCVLLTMSGALRLSRSSAAIGTALAIAIFSFAAVGTQIDPVQILLASGLLLLIGALGAGIATLVKRVVTTQVERSTLSTMYREAQLTIDAREQVLKIVSHDLRNPLHTISMSTSLMLEVPMNDEQRAKRLQMIKRAGERMTRMVQDLLDVAKFESGRLGIDKRPLEIKPLIGEAMDMLRPLANERSLRLESVATDDLPIIAADAGRVLQVFSNLIGNAIKFTPPGGRIAIRAEPVGGQIRFAVSDTGSGIPAAHLSQVFGRFWQADASDRRGIGLGLAIAKGIVEAHGGRIWVESEVGRGTTFYFTLTGGTDTRRTDSGLRASAAVATLRTSGTADRVAAR